MTDQDEFLRTANTRARVEGRRERYEARATSGGAHRIVRKRVSSKQAYAETPAVRIASKPQGRIPLANSRLASPAALLMLAGLVLIYVALHGWDQKYGTFNGSFAGYANTPKGRAAAQTASSHLPSSTPSTGANA